jgi:hypothetical protein
MKNGGVFLPLVVGLVVVAVLATLAVEGGWVLWLPAGLALAVVGWMRHARSG